MDVEEELLVESGELALGRRDEELVGEVHHDAVVAGGMLGDRDFELGGHEGGVACRVEDVVEAGAELVARGVLEVKAPTDAAAEREELRMAEALGQPTV